MKNLKMKLAAVAALPTLAVTKVYAEVPAEVVTELSSLKDDALTVATAVLVAIIAVFAFKFIRRGI